MAKYATFQTWNNTSAPEVQLNIPNYDYEDILYPEQLFQPTYTTQPTEEVVADPEITTEEPKERRKFKKKTEDTKQYDHTISFQQLCKNIGVDVIVTSELRPGAKTKSGKASYHSLQDQYGRPMAIDVVPTDGDFEGLKNKLLNSPEARNWFEKGGFGIINEIIPQVMSKTGASGKHLHIGKDQWAQRILNRWLQNPSIKVTQFIG